MKLAALTKAKPTINHTLLGEKFTLLLKTCLNVEFHYKVLFFFFYVFTYFICLTFFIGIFDHALRWSGILRLSHTG